MGTRFQVTKTITIQRPLDEVYAFATDRRNDVRWRKGVASFELDRPGPATIGMHSTEVLRFMGRKMITRGEVTQAVPNQIMAFRSVSGPFPVSGYRRFEAHGAGTEFTYHVAGEVSGVFSVFSAVLTPVFERQVARDLKRLKALLERPDR